MIEIHLHLPLRGWSQHPAMSDTIGFVTPCNSWESCVCAWLWLKCVRARVRGEVSLDNSLSVPVYIRRAHTLYIYIYVLALECVRECPRVSVCAHVRRRVTTQDKGLTAGGECSPLTPSVTGLKHRNVPSGCVCVCMCMCLSEGSCVWWIQPSARWPAVNYELLINLGKGTHRARERKGMTSVCPHLMWQD